MSKDNPCEGCGVCCMHMRTPPFFPGTDEYNGLPKALRDEVKAHALRETPCSKRLDLLGMAEDAPCLWFDMRAGTCREWEIRPITCREFVPGESACVKMRGEVGLPPVAPAPEPAPPKPT